MIKENQSRSYYMTMLVFFTIASACMLFYLGLSIQRSELTAFNAFLLLMFFLGFSLNAKTCYEKSRTAPIETPIQIPRPLSKKEGLFMCILAYALLTLFLTGGIYRIYNFQEYNAFSLFVLVIGILALHFKGQEYYKKFKKSEV